MHRLSPSSVRGYACVSGSDATGTIIIFLANQNACAEVKTLPLPAKCNKTEIIYMLLYLLDFMLSTVYFDVFGT